MNLAGYIGAAGDIAKALGLEQVSGVAQAITQASTSGTAEVPPVMSNPADGSLGTAASAATAKAVANATAPAPAAGNGALWLLGAGVALLVLVNLKGGK